MPPLPGLAFALRKIPPLPRWATFFRPFGTSNHIECANLPNFGEHEKFLTPLAGSAFSRISSPRFVKGVIPVRPQFRLVGLSCSCPLRIWR